MLDFARHALETAAAWTGVLPQDALGAVTPDHLRDAASDPRGRLLVVSHHGNAELSRALAAPALRCRMTVLVHTRHAGNFNRVIRRLNPEMPLKTVQVTEIGPETAVQLQTSIDRGEWVVIAGDRVPVSSSRRISRAPFLGQDAAFSQGPWILAAILGCPVDLLFCWREGRNRWRLALEPFAPKIVLPRTDRQGALRELAVRYGGRLEHYCLAQPYQWYNFFDFWATEDKA
jgi:predicted LPLAT superfamily acyltransferase